MLTIEKHVTASPDQWKIIIEGTRNPMNSWDKSDSYYYDDKFYIGDADLNLMLRLSRAGSDHAKFRRMIPVWITLSAPLYWWKEFDTYKVGTVANSCSTMHKIHAKPIDFSDFSIEDFVVESVGDDIDFSLNDIFYHVIEDCETLRQKYLETGDPRYWRALIQLLPEGYIQKRTVLVNYETLANIYRSRRNHKLAEWHTFCDFIETLPYSEIITGEATDNRCTTYKQLNLV